MRKVAAVVVVVSLIAAFGFISFVLSIGTTVTRVKVDAYVFDRDTTGPVPNCLLAFETSESGIYPQSAAISDHQGHLSFETNYSHGPSLFLACPFLRERKPQLRLYIGNEAWDVMLLFKQPWILRGEIVPRIEVQRSLAHQEVSPLPPGSKGRSAGFDPLSTEGADRLVRATLRFEPEENDHEVYRVRISTYLDKKQIAACRVPAGGVEAVAP